MNPSPIPLATLVLGLLAATPLCSQSWKNLSSGKPGTGTRTPRLDASPIQLGKVLSLSITLARPNSTAYFVIGSKRVDLKIWAGTLVPAVDVILGTKTDARGNATVSIPIPNDPRLLALTPYVQCLVADPGASFSIAFSNAVAWPTSPLAQQVEAFKTSQFLDKDLSAGTWGNGVVTFSPIGGSGIHGIFDPAQGRKTSGNSSPIVYEWRTDGMTIKTPARSYNVTDGRFFFQSLVIPAGVVVNFVGANPARIWVRGKTVIGGMLTANGESLRLNNFFEAQKIGETGGEGGAFGSRGGDGGDRCDGRGPRPAFNGQPGQDINLRRGHAYAANRAGTGGRGSQLFPTSGLTSAIKYSASAVISQQLNRGGGGGGFVTAGGTGQVSFPRVNQGLLAPGVTPGGKGTPFPPTFPKTPGATPADYFLVGGSGGGGGGSCCTAAIRSSPSTTIYRAARAGGGGGGALGMRIGGSLIVEKSARIEARGGTGPLEIQSFGTRFLPTPGGGGSGGSLFLQVNLSLNNRGTISVKGGAGGRNRPLDVIFAGSNAWGGSGSNGILHFETAQDPRKYPVGATVPSRPPVGKIGKGDVDDIVTVQSLWYPANLVSPPVFVRYEIVAKVNGKNVLYSDDPKVGSLAAGAASPLRFAVQGAQVQRDPTGKLVVKPNTRPSPFTPYVGPFSTTQPSLFNSGATGYRFELTLDRSLKETVNIEKITVFWCR